MDDYNKFLTMLEKEDKDSAVLFILNLLDSKKYDLYTIYKDFLERSLIDFGCGLNDKDICIWKEHTRSSIVRTIIESTYNYIIKIKNNTKQLNKKIVVFCPQGEFHEIGAIIVSNYFTLAGFDSIYIGANTPNEQVISAIKGLKPDYLAISVTNYYNLVVTQKLTNDIKNVYPKIKIIVGGQAFTYKGALDYIKYDYHIDSMKEILEIAGDLK